MFSIFSCLKNFYEFFLMIYNNKYRYIFIRVICKKKSVDLLLVVIIIFIVLFLLILYRRFSGDEVLEMIDF